MEPLIQMLRDVVPSVRAAAAEALGKLGDPQAVNSLVALLRDNDPQVRTIASRSLEKLGWRPDTDSQRVLQILATGNQQQIVAPGGRSHRAAAGNAANRPAEQTTRSGQSPGGNR